MAVMAGVKSAVQIHISRGDDLNARDPNGMTTLMLSAARNKPAICRLLLDAGADPSLVDHTGKTAMDIALAKGADTVAAMLEAACQAISSCSSPNIAVLSEPRLPSITRPFESSDVETAPGGFINAVAQAQTSEPAGLVEQETPSPATTEPVRLEDAEELNLSGWEAEEEPTRPEIDLEVLTSASAVQAAITTHAPIDSSADWDDIDTSLPKTALPLARSDDVEGRARLRCLLLRALREGSVPRLAVQDQATNEDRSANPEAEAYLAMVINDLGAELDERFEYSNADESHEVFVDPAESYEEETAIDEALSVIDRATSPRHDPLQIYQRELQRQRLLSAEEEIQLAQDMEEALDAALDALITWPDGLAQILAAGAAAVAGSRQLSSIWVRSAEPGTEPVAAEDFDAGMRADEESEDVTGEDDEPAVQTPVDAGAATFADALGRLAALTKGCATLDASPQEIRLALTGLHLSRDFLLELFDTAKGLSPCLGFTSAMARFLKARDRMAAANLKLAFFHAKKYRYSGEPLDDLAQAGNIGLLKAVDRYDWRRGFRFSTFATWWIRQQIGRHIADRARTIRLPVHVYEKVQRMERMAQTFEVTAGHEPTVSELSELMEMHSGKLMALLRIAPDVSYIDELPVDDMIACDARDAYSSPDPADIVGTLQLHQAVDRFIATLAADKGKEDQILRLRFGLGNGEPLTLEQIGGLMGVTRERVRQIEAKALKKLRHSARSEPFARTVLGLSLAPPSFTTDIKEPKAVKRASTGTTNRTPAVRPSPIPPRQTGEINNPAVRPPTKLSTLDRLLAQAVDLGIHVEDGRPDSDRIWVELRDTDKKAHRQLARQLLELGFVFWPGKGYWK